MDLNARAPLLLVKALLPLLRRARGSVVNVADVGGGLVPWRGYAAYAASKAALVRLTECLALDLAPEVRVNAVAPGTVLWPESYPAALRRTLARADPARPRGRPGRRGAGGPLSRRRAVRHGRRPAGRRRPASVRKGLGNSAHPRASGFGDAPH